MTTPDGTDFVGHRVRKPARVNVSRPVDFTTAEVYEHLEYVFSGRHGYVHIGTVDRSTGPKPKLENRNSYQWPEQAANLVSDVVRLQATPWTEVFFCPYPFKTRTRAVGESSSRWIVHQDVDKPLSNALRTWLRTRGFRMVSTGTPGHVQVYARLSRSLTHDEHRGVMTALRAKLGGDDKIADNDLLKMPGGYNHKHHPSMPEGKRNESRGNVRVIFQGRNKVDADALIVELGARPVTEVHRETTYKDVSVPPRLSDKIRSAVGRPSAPEGERSDDLYARVCTVAEGKYSRDEIHAILEACDAGHERYNGRWHSQIDAMLHKWEQAKGKELVKYDVDENFWSTRDILRHIHTTALAGMASPWAVLGVVLARMLHIVPPNVHLPMLGGGIRQLNLFVSLIGDSGVGKGTASNAAERSVAVGMVGYPVNIGSGEGIAKAYRERTAGKIVVKANAVLFDVPEVVTWNSLTGRSGTTLVGEVLKGFAGESLGFQNADDTKTVPVERNTYRMGLVIGAQPGMCGPLLGNVMSGLPQRFLWLPTWHDEAPDVEPVAPDPWVWEMPYVGSEGHVVDVWDGAVRAIRDRRRAVLRRQVTIDPLDSHTDLIRLRVATSLALLDGRLDVTQDDWELSGLVMLTSERTRQHVIDVLKETSRRENFRRGVALGEQQAAAASTVVDVAIDACSRAMVGALNKAGNWMPGNELRKRIHIRHRDSMLPAMAKLIGEGIVERKPHRYRGQTGWQYRAK